MTAFTVHTTLALTSSERIAVSREEACSWTPQSARGFQTVWR